MIIAVTNSGRRSGYVVYDNGSPLQAGEADWLDVLGIVRDFLSLSATPPVIITERYFVTDQIQQTIGALMWLAHDAGAEFRRLIPTLQMTIDSDPHYWEVERRAHHLLARYITESSRA